MRETPASGEVTPKRRPSRRLARFVPLVVLLAILASGLLLGWQRYFTLDYLAETRSSIKTFAHEQGPLAGLLYVLGYAAAVAVAFPATWLLTLAGGFIYGMVLGGLLAAIGASIGASILFWAARTAFGDGLRQRAGGFVARAAKGFENNAFTYMLALRLAPVLPFSVVNVLPALFKVPFATYVAATLIGIIPGALVYASIGQGLEAVLVEVARSGRAVGIADLVTPGLTLGLAGLALLAVAPTVYTLIRRRNTPPDQAKQNQAK
ncbi:MAG: TVP38/TMEM64 family protein [Devosia sp.]